jgi:hypothetical protein
MYAHRRRSTDGRLKDARLLVGAIGEGCDRPVAGPLKIVWRRVVGTRKRLAVVHFDLSPTVTAGPRKDADSSCDPLRPTATHLQPPGLQLAMGGRISDDPSNFNKGPDIRREGGLWPCCFIYGNVVM